MGYTFFRVDWLQHSTMSGRVGTRSVTFLKKVAVCTGRFQTERILVCRVNQYPVGLNMTVT
jgi:hypothetical protein